MYFNDNFKLHWIKIWQKTNNSRREHNRCLRNCWAATYLFIIAIISFIQILWKSSKTCQLLSLSRPIWIQVFFLLRFMWMLVVGSQSCHWPTGVDPAFNADRPQPVFWASSRLSIHTTFGINMMILHITKLKRCWFHCESCWRNWLSWCQIIPN